MNSIGELVEKQDHKNAWEALLDQARHIQGYSEFVSLCQWREKLVRKLPIRTYASPSESHFWAPPPQKWKTP